MTKERENKIRKLTEVEFHLRLKLDSIRNESPYEIENLELYKNMKLIETEYNQAVYYLNVAMRPVTYI